MLCFSALLNTLTDSGAGYPVGEGDPALPLVVRVRPQPRVHVLQVRLDSGRLLGRHVHDALFCRHIPGNTASDIYMKLVLDKMQP